jgi:hypothetical protein
MTDLITGTRQNRSQVPGTIAIPFENVKRLALGRPGAHAGKTTQCVDQLFEQWLSSHLG